MSSKSDQVRSAAPLRDWLPSAFLLAGTLSFLSHLLVLLFCATMLRSCDRSPVGFTNEETREIGIYVKEVGDHPNAAVTGEPRDTDAIETRLTSPVSTDDFRPTRITDERPPVDLALPITESPKVIGTGVNLPAGTSVNDPRQPVKSGGGQRPPASGVVGGPPGAAFMGARDQGSKVVFVIDASGSMASHNAMQVAKNALMSSLQALDANQQFLIIFYDDQPTILHLRDIQKPQLYSASEMHKTLARQKIAGIQPGTGTKHVPALEMALSLRPDVIFFLTDAQEPPIHPEELKQIKQSNVYQTRIHAIEFGVGPEISETVNSKNFLRKLSYQNGGTYRYHDVTKFK